jgi:hypothetical protein
MNTAQRKATDALRLAMAQAYKAGLVLRVFDGSVLVCPKGHLNDHRYLGEHAAMLSWMYDCENITEGINADGGAGI